MDDQLHMFPHNLLPITTARDLNQKGPLENYLKPFHVGWNLSMPLVLQRKDQGDIPIWKRQSPKQQADIEV